MCQLDSLQPAIPRTHTHTHTFIKHAATNASKLVYPHNHRPMLCQPWCRLTQSTIIIKVSTYLTIPTSSQYILHPTIAILWQQACLQHTQSLSTSKSATPIPPLIPFLLIPPLDSLSPCLLPRREQDRPRTRTLSSPVMNTCRRGTSTLCFRKCCHQRLFNMILLHASILLPWTATESLILTSCVPLCRRRAERHMCRSIERAEDTRHLFESVWWRVCRTRASRNLKRFWQC